MAASQVEYSKIKEIRTAPRAFGLWGDMVRRAGLGAALAACQPHTWCVGPQGRSPCVEDAPGWRWVHWTHAAGRQPCRRTAGSSRTPCPSPADPGPALPAARQVIFLKDGSRLELAGLERFQEIRDYIYGHMVL